MERQQFTFYRSYYDAIKRLPKREQAPLLLAICAYALDEEEKKLDGIPFSIFTLIKPTLDSGRAKAKNRENKTRTNQEQTKNKTETEPKETKNKTTTKPKQNRKEGEKEIESERENDSSFPPKSPQGDVFAEFAKGNPNLLEALQDFEQMRKQIKRPMTDKAKSLLVGRLDKLAKSPEAQIAILQQSILHNWQDVYDLKEDATDRRGQKPIQRVQRHDDALNDFEKAAVAKLMARHEKEELGHETAGA